MTKYALGLLLFALTACDGNEPTGDSGLVDSGEANTAADTWETFASDFMASYCVACHSSGAKDFTTLAAVIANSEGIRCGTASTEQPDCPSWPPPGQFPVGDGPKPTDEERDRLVAWINAGHTP